MVVIGCAGQKRFGKDTLADRVAPQLEWTMESFSVVSGLKKTQEKWGRSSFAYGVKEIYCRTFGKNLAFIEEWKENPEPPPGMTMCVRHALQFIGDGFRKIQPDIWIEKAFRDPYEYEHKIFSDARYVNEAKKIHSKDGFNFLIYRPSKLNFDESLSEAELRPYLIWCAETGKEGLIEDWSEYQAAIQEEHSEFFKNLGYFDYFVRNDGSLEDFHRKIDNIIVPFLKENYDERRSNNSHTDSI